MKVKELIEALKKVDQETEVVIAFNARDHWRTTITEPVEHVSEVSLVWSGYHERWKVLDLGKNPEKGDKTLEAIVLSDMEF